MKKRTKKVVKIIIISLIVAIILISIYNFFGISQNISSGLSSSTLSGAGIT